MESGAARLPLLAEQSNPGDHARFETARGSAVDRAGRRRRYSRGTLSSAAFAVGLPQLRLQTHLSRPRRRVERVKEATGMRNSLERNARVVMKSLIFAAVHFRFNVCSLRCLQNSGAGRHLPAPLSRFSIEPLSSLLVQRVVFRPPVVLRGLPFALDEPIRV